MTIDRKEYEKWYRKKVVDDAIIKYGDKCSCEHCVLPRGFRPLRIVLSDSSLKKQYQIALTLKRSGYKKDLAKVFCYDCSEEACKHDYERSTAKKYLPASKKIKFKYKINRQHVI